MAGINDIKPLGPVWPTPATKPVNGLKDRKQKPGQQSPQQSPQQSQDNADKDDDDETNHIDEYA